MSMTFFIETKLNDGLAEAPGYEFEVDDVADLANYIEDELTTDRGDTYGPGCTLTLKRTGEEGNR